MQPFIKNTNNYKTFTVPVKMQVPKDTTLKFDVGSSTTLPCLAEGYPKPNIRWTYYSKNPSIRPKTLK